MTTFAMPFLHADGHVLLDLDGVRTILDTGSTMSFGSVPGVNFAGAIHPLHPTFRRGKTIDQICALLRQHTPASESFAATALIGLDVLRGKRLELDWERCILKVSVPEDSGAARPEPKIPRTTVKIGDQEFRAIIDTGAWLSYLLPDVAPGPYQAGPVTDYNPMIEVMNVDRHEVKVSFGGRTRTLTVGIATPRLVPMIRAEGVQVLIGNDILHWAGITIMDIGL